MSGKIHLDKKTFLYTICFALFCLIDQRIKTGAVFDGAIESFRDLTGVVMAVIILSHYKFSDFKENKLPYLIWSFTCAIGGILFVLFGEGWAVFMNDRIVLSFAFFLFGCVLIRIFSDVFVAKKVSALNKKMTCVWLVMMVFMILSRSEYIWPLAYLIMFGAFYLTDFSSGEREKLFQGMLNGFILAFFLMQGWCFVFRPYDQPRYVGVYSNCNLNALFYIEVLAAVFTKILYVSEKNYSRFIKGFYWLGTGVLYSFIFMTIGRAAWVTSFLFGLCFLAAMKYILRKKNFLKNALVMVLCFCVAFPLTFSAMRYLPPLFHHPVWFWGEWSESKVHSWDAWDSEKYVDLDEFLDAAVGRISDSVESLMSRAVLTVKAQGMTEPMSAGTEENISEPAASPKPDPRYEAAVWKDPSMAADSIAVRREVYAHYARGLNLWGHPYSEQGFQLTPVYWIGHAHNIYLQYGTDFGIIVMILFIVLVVWTVVLLTRKFLRTRDARFFGWLLLFLIPNLFGLFEFSWGVGSMSITMMFIAWREAICSEVELT